MNRPPTPTQTDMREIIHHILVFLPIRNVVLFLKCKSINFERSLLLRLRPEDKLVCASTRFGDWKAPNDTHLNYLKVWVFLKTVWTCRLLSGRKGERIMFTQTTKCTVQTIKNMRLTSLSWATPPHRAAAMPGITANRESLISIKTTSVNLLAQTRAC